MIATTDLDLKVVEHVARVTRVNRDAWMHEAPVTTRATRTQGISAVVASTRRHAGMAVVHAGYRLLPPNLHPEPRS